MIKRIFLDIDGVLNIFPLYVMEQLGMSATYENYPRECGWDIVAAANHYQPTRQIPWTTNAFWKSITRSMWANCTKSAEFWTIINESVEIVGEKNVFILSATARDPDSAAGKMEWIYKFCPDWMHRQYLLSPNKHLLANDNSLLIDDADHNVSAFREAGGHAYLMPRPWNANHASTESLRFFFDNIKEYNRTWQS